MTAVDNKIMSRRKQRKLVWFGSLLVAIAAGTGLTNQFLPRVQAQNAGAITVKSDIQEANTESGIVTARGNVFIDYPARAMQATATQAQYFSKERQLVLSGDVFVLQEGNSMRAERMTYSIDEGRFLATPAQDEQVESIYIVPEDEPAEESTAAPVTSEEEETVIDPVITLPSEEETTVEGEADVEPTDLPADQEQDPTVAPVTPSSDN